MNSIIIENNPWLSEFDIPAIREIGFISIDNDSFFQDLKSLKEADVDTLRLANLQELFTLDGIPHHLKKLKIENVPLNDVSALTQVNNDIEQLIEIILPSGTTPGDYYCDLFSDVVKENHKIVIPQCTNNT